MTNANQLTAKLTTQEIKEQLFILAPKTLSNPELKVWQWLLDALEARLSEKDLDAFLEQLDAIELKTKKAVA